MKITELFVKIQDTAGTNDKKQLLKDNLNPTIQQIFEDTYGSQKYYIKQFFPVLNLFGTLTLDNDYNVFHEALTRLSNREVTGNEAIGFITGVFYKFDTDSQQILRCIIDRNLKIGLSYNGYLDIIGTKESKFEVALAENLNKAKNVDPIDGSYFISRKLDGARCICFIDQYYEGGVMETNIEFRSRQNKPILTLNNLVNDITDFIQPLGPGRFVLDGEVCLVDENGNESFHGLMKEITRKNHTITNPKYMIFDILRRSDFDGETQSILFKDRYNELVRLDTLTPRPHLQIVIQEHVDSQEVMDAWIKLAKDNGWEGCMLRKNAPYKKGRSKDLLKIKGMVDAEYVVIGVEYGKATYNEGGHKEFDVVSSLIIEHKGNHVNVGSGLSKEQRLSWYNNPDDILGKTITVQYFEETQDSKTGEYSLRFPVLKYVYDNGREL